MSTAQCVHYGKIQVKYEQDSSKVTQAYIDPVASKGL